MAETSPLVSIWIPVFNGGPLIWKTLESALHQTYPNIEVIVFDDASTDNTKDVVEEYARRDKRIKYFKTEKNIGVNKSFPKILKLCSGEFAIFLCCDDWISRHYIEECVKLFIENRETAVVTGRVFSIVEKEGRWVFTREPKPGGGAYSRDWFGKNAYRNFTTSMIILGMARTKDFFRVALELSAIIDNPPPEIGEELRLLMQYDYGCQAIICPKIVSGYDNFRVSDKAILLKTENSLDHYMETKGSMKPSAKFGLLSNDTAKGILKLYGVDRKLHDISFRGHWKEYLSRMRIFFGQEALSTVVIEAVRRRFSRSFFKEFSPGKDLENFFEDYTRREKAMSVWFVIPRLVLRCADMIRRKLWKPATPDIYKSEYFLNREKKFAV
ncbi:MAG: glycosyltransferase family A protein [Nanoarchaeota archaeon]|nr:glycosyltransferase family A protein [Nanoarchaeota archaeon]